MPTEQEHDPRSVGVECPCCSARLVVDTETGAVLEARPARDPRGDFDSLLDEVKTGESRREELFRKAFEAEQQRTDVLEKKFKRARRKAGTDGGGEPDSVDRK